MALTREEILEIWTAGGEVIDLHGDRYRAEDYTCVRTLVNGHVCTRWDSGRGLDHEAGYLARMPGGVEPLSPLVPEPPAAPVDPKAAEGATKPLLALFPASASVASCLALENGAMRYGIFNWRTTGVEVMTYLHAAKRHIDAFVDGEEFISAPPEEGDPAAEDTGVPHLGAAIASLAIVIDAMACGTARDNRPPPGGAARIQRAAKKFKAERTGAKAEEHLRPVLHPEPKKKP